MNASEPLWFARFGDIPGVEYATPADVDPSKLRRRGERPEVSYYDARPSVWWVRWEESSSESPANAHLLNDPRKAPTSRVLRNLAEALELPGDPSDYHFAIQSVISLLRSRRRDGPQVFAEMDRLAWLDVSLIQARPDVITYGADGEQRSYGVEAFAVLMDMYLKEGAVGDAARVLALAEHHGQAFGPSADAVRERVAALAAEDAPA